MRPKVEQKIILKRIFESHNPVLRLYCDIFGVSLVA
jgi:hypothetical protein